MFQEQKQDLLTTDLSGIYQVPKGLSRIVTFSHSISSNI